MGFWELVGILWKCIDHTGVVYGKELELTGTSFPISYTTNLGMVGQSDFVPMRGV